MLFEQIKSDRMANFSYLIGDEVTKEAAIVDPSFNPEKLIKRAELQDLNVKYVINTHSHWDHTAGNELIASRFGSKIVAHKNASVNRDVSIDDEEVLYLGKIQIKVIYTPGHTLDGICLLVDKKLITGDTLFVGECGHTRHGSSKDLYYSLFHKLMKLDDDVELYPGHDYGSFPSSTIGLERRSNYVLKKRTLEEFIVFMSE